jgi:hypothetical protein
MLLDLLFIGLVATLEPLPLIAMILLLAADGGVMKGLGFVLGWMATLLAIVGVTIAVTGGKPLIAHSSPSTAALAVKLLLGVVLVVIAWRVWKKLRTNGSTPSAQPKWMAKIDSVRPVGAAGLAFVLQPWVVIVAGVSTITTAKVSNAAEVSALVAFCLLCSSSFIAMEIYAVLRPEEVHNRLNALLNWITTHRDPVIVFLSLGLGLYLMAISISGLVN